VSSTNLGVDAVEGTGLGVANATGEATGLVEATGLGEAEAMTCGETDGETRADGPEVVLHAAITRSTDAKAATLISALTPTPSESYEFGANPLAREPT
jgi:hypothetical protein